jgi:hypothetical protein
MLRQACPEPVEGLSTNGKSFTISALDPFALSLSKGGGASFLHLKKETYIVLTRTVFPAGARGKAPGPPTYGRASCDGCLVHGLPE